MGEEIIVRFMVAESERVYVEIKVKPCEVKFITQNHLQNCPHCDGLVEIQPKDINCGIFRHAVLKSTTVPINPHTPQAECERLLLAGLIYGCGKPFRRLPNNQLVKCDYI